MLSTIGTYLDNGFFIISAKRAGMLCKAFNGTPRPGYERKVIFDNVECWVARTIHHNKVVWTVRVAR